LQIPHRFYVSFWKIMIMSNHTKKCSLFSSSISCIIKYKFVEYPMNIIFHIYVVKYYWKFLKSLNFQSFKIPHFLNYEKKLVCLIGFFYRQLNFIIWILWKSFVKISFFNEIKFHFQKSLTKNLIKWIFNLSFLTWMCYKGTTYHDSYGFKWQSKSISIFYGNFWHLMPFFGSFECVLTHLENIKKSKKMC